MSATDKFLWPDVAHEQRIFEGYVDKKDWKYEKSPSGYKIEVNGKIYRSFQDYLVLHHQHTPRPTSVLKEKRVRKKPQFFDLVTP